MDRRQFIAAASASVAFGPAACAQSLAPSPPSPRAAALIGAARAQVGVTRAYDPAYTRIPFPGGDVPRVKGVCTDVVVRAYRDALRLDLQALVNADMRRAFGAYPRRWGLAHPDASIDHRRVPNLQTFFARAGARLAVPAALADWRGGDIFTCLVSGDLSHIGVVSDRRSFAGHPLVLHNIGQGTREDDALPYVKLTGRYRWALT